MIGPRSAGGARHDLQVTAFLVLMGGYLIFNYPFMQLRIPPGEIGVPLGEIFIALVVLTTDVPLVLSRMGAAVFLLPFLIWWAWGAIRLVFDVGGHGFWALRDATQLMESSFVVVGFALAGRPGAVARMARWLRIFIAISCVYGLLFIYADELAAISPKLYGASDQPIPIFGAFATTAVMMLLGAFHCMTRPARSRGARLRNELVAGFLVAFALIVIQARTTYLQLFGMAVLLFFLRPRSLGAMALAIPVLLALLVVISAFDIQISGRLTSHVSLDFFWKHIQAMYGAGSDGHGGVAQAAEGVSLRLGWWDRLYDQLTADPAVLLTGLGFGIPLTDFRDTLGVVAREPHNSVLSVAARLGLVGLVAWLWMQIELFRASYVAYRDCRRRGRTEEADLILLVIAFAILVLASCFGEDTMEKPYNAIPYYALWGFSLRIAYQLRAEAARARSAIGRRPAGFPQASPS
jgi:hypothetical protein